MERTRAILLTLIGALLTLSVLLVLPFLQYFLLAVLLAYPLRPLQKRYEQRLGPRLTAGTLVVCATVSIILPVLWISRTVFREIRVFVGQVRRGEFTFEEFEQWVFDVSGEEIDVLSTAQTVLRETGIGTVNGALGLFGTITNVLIGVALMMFLLYYFLKDADKFNHWLRITVPLPDHIYTELRQELDDIIWAVLASHVLIAVVQGIVAGLGLIVLGIPNAIFWTAVMVFLAVLPIIGSFLVWGPAGLYLFSIGQPVAGSVLLVYGAIVVSFSDDFLRPLIIDRYTDRRLNPSAVVVGILGGIYLFGFIGIFFGPVIIGSLRASLDVYRHEYVDSKPREQSADGESESSTADDSPDSTAKRGDEAENSDHTQPETETGENGHTTQHSGEDHDTDSRNHGGSST
jgi:predicted PurR-regulated permease PerM